MRDNITLNDLKQTSAIDYLDSLLIAARKCNSVAGSIANDSLYSRLRDQLLTKITDEMLANNYDQDVWDYVRLTLEGSGDVQYGAH